MDRNTAIDALQDFLDSEDPEEFHAAAREALDFLRNPEPTTFRWTLTIEVSHDLVADGFDVKNQVDNKGPIGGELSGLGSIVDSWESHHCHVRIIDAPDPKTIRRAQGYPDSETA
jgi:hypothetical protein